MGWSHSGERAFFCSKKLRTTTISDKQAWQFISAELHGRLQSSSTFPGFKAIRQIWCCGKPAGVIAGKAGFRPQLCLLLPGLCFLISEMGIVIHCSWVAERRDNVWDGVPDLELVLHKHSWNWEPLDKCMQSWGRISEKDFSSSVSVRKRQKISEFKMAPTATGRASWRLCATCVCVCVCVCVPGTILFIYFFLQ